MRENNTVHRIFHSIPCKAVTESVELSSERLFLARFSGLLQGAMISLTLKVTFYKRKVLPQKGDFDVS